MFFQVMMGFLDLSRMPRSILLFLAVFCTPAVDSLSALTTSPTNSGEVDRRSALSIGTASAAASLGLVGGTKCASAVPQVAGGLRVPLSGNTGPKNGFPLASFGLQIYDDSTAYKLTLVALAAGYRNFFASVLAGNQRGFAKAIKASGIPRDEIYICGTVLSNRAKGEVAAFKKTKRGCDENLEAMAVGDIGKLDMIMLDYPGPDVESIRGQWRAFEEMRAEGTVDSLAVSNFSPGQLDAILTMPDVTKPTVNQLPFSLAYHPPGMIEYNQERGILVQSWSPLSRVVTNPSFRPLLASIGSSYGKSAAQVGLRWIVQNGAAFTTQSKTQEHFIEDIDVFDFELTQEEMDRLSRLTV